MPNQNLPPNHVRKKEVALATFELKAIDDLSSDLHVEVHVIRGHTLISISRITIRGDGIPELASDEY
ncbi:hypothetical protein GCM10009734_51720 [Nonomuraea bangladeshensis]